MNLDSIYALISVLLLFFAFGYLISIPVMKKMNESFLDYKRAWEEKERMMNTKLVKRKLKIKKLKFKKKKKNRVNGV